MTFLIAVPTGIKFFNWIGTMWKGQLTFETPMLFSVGFLVTFLLGGLSGVLLASPPIDFHVSDTYFVVAHFHYVLFGTIVFATYAGIYFWFPKMTGRLLDERLGKLHFWLTFIGSTPRSWCSTGSATRACPPLRADYLPSDGFTTLNIVSTIGAFILGVSTIPFPGTCSRAGVTARSSPSTTRGVTATPLEGRPRARRRGTTSPSCPGSVPSGPRFELHYPTWSSGCGPRPIGRAHGPSDGDVTRLDENVRNLGTHSSGMYDVVHTRCRC